jgi:sphingolipid delta-4 desaturase
MFSTLTEQSALINIPTKKLFSDTYDAPNFERNLNDFHFMDHDEPHYTRRRMILEKHPEIKQLMKPDLTSFWITLVLIGVQVYICYLIQELPFWPLLLITYAFGGVISNAFFVLIHDFTHFTSFRSSKVNNLIAIMANLGNGIPTAMAFAKFHADHHNFLGRPDMDPDLACRFEISYYRTAFRKVLHVAFMLIWYIIRPYCQGNKAPSFMEIINILTIIVWDAFIFHIFGWRAVFYLVIGTLCALGPNPVGFRHFAEHFEFVKGQDTYSYYGPLNYITMNIGYHIEHHDFPNIPWRNLPKIKEIAPEFYKTLPSHSSYFLIVWKYIRDPNFGPWCRIGRIHGDDIKRKHT